MDLSVPARISRDLLLRREDLPKPVRETAWKAQTQLRGRYRKLSHTGKSANIVSVAIIRELGGFVWTIAKHAQAAAA